MTASLPDQILGGLFDWTCHTSLRASLLILLVLLVCRLLGRRLPPIWQYGLWFLVVARLLLPLAPPAWFSLWNAVPAHESAAAEVKPPAALSPPDAPGVATSPLETPLFGPRKPADRATGGLGRSWSWRSVVVLVWLGGVVACLGHTWRRHRLWRHILQEGQEIQDSAVLDLLRRCEAEVRSTGPVRLVQTRRIGTPAIFGWRQPCLVLPRSFLEGFREEELRLVFLHELIHVQRRDVTVNWLLILLQAWHWFNPLVWLACRQFRAARELYCDALVLRRLDARDRRAYGQTLVKLAERLSSGRLSPSLVPVLRRKSELKRRILMMTQPARAPRLFSVVAVAAMVVLVGLTFTGAAEKDAAPAAVQKEGTPPPSAEQGKTARQGIEALKKELDRIDAQVRHKQAELDALKAELKVTRFEEIGSYQPDTDAETFRYMERTLIDAKSRHQQLASLYEQLNGMSHAELRKALATASPDTILTSLLENQAVYQQQLVLKQTQFDSGHPEIQALQKVLDKIDRQIEERMEGIMLGLKARVTAEERTVKHLETRSVETKEKDSQRSIQLQPLLVAKRDLESLRLVRERLQLRIIQEEVDAALPKSTGKD